LSGWIRVYRVRKK